MADYWIKLYHEIIDDPKMATLPDRLWRRAIELFLLAGRLCPDKSGDLPDVIQLAWLLRLPPDELSLDLAQLETVGIIKRTITGCHVVNFTKRQSAVPDADRQRQHRQRQQRQQYATVTPQENNVTPPVTDLSRNVTQINRDRLTEAETESSAAAGGNADVARVMTAYHGNIGALTSMIAQSLEDDIRDYGADWVIAAIMESAKANKRSLNYAEAILKRWAREGFKSEFKPAAPAPTPVIAPAPLAEYQPPSPETLKKLREFRRRLGQKPEPEEAEYVLP